LKTFVFWMLLASGMGFIKLLSLAYVMPVDEYGQYVAYFGVATLTATLVSMGIVEKTIKAYPRQWVTGQRYNIFYDAFMIAGLISARLLVVCILLIIISYFHSLPVTISTIILTLALSLGTSVLALIGSLYRAAGSQKALQNFSWWRSFATLSVALPCGAIFGWQGALAGEIAANVLGITIGVRQLKVLYQNIQLNPETISMNSAETLAASVDRGHFQLYFANLAVLVVTMVDKAWLGATLGASLAGTYGIVMLIPQVAQLIVNVIVQYTGPLIIKSAHLNQKNTSKVDSVEFQTGFLALFSFILVVGACIAKRLPLLSYIFEKFAISDISLFIVGFIATGHIYNILEFHLIARNRERDVLMASIFSFMVFILLFSALSIYCVAIEWFLAAMALSRWTQVLYLRAAYHRYA
jgi:O-antigen/teichoic acid export membrane protein